MPRRLPRTGKLSARHVTVTMEWRSTPKATQQIDAYRDLSASLAYEDVTAGVF